MEAPHHDALTHQALRGIALMSTESIQPNCSNNAAWNDPSAGMGLRLLALLGSVVLTLFNPQGIRNWACRLAACGCCRLCLDGSDR